MKKMNILKIISTALFVASCAQPVSKMNETPVNPEAPNSSESIPDAAEVTKATIDYKLRYKFLDPYNKVVDNRGNGYENLYGTRNFRAVLHGVYYRGGANNSYNREGIRSNSNPLPTTGLENLCKEGFSTAIYFYTTNYETAPKVVNCRDRQDSNTTLNYKQISSLSATTSTNEAILSLVYDRIKGKLPGPIYGHCWNGWHASGYAASILLKQFCGYTDSEAEAYWRKNTDGNDGASYAGVVTKVRAFKPVAKFNISAAESAAICPTK
ncbi:MAG: hypothetical protein H7328_08750 [Bdellovibrio sp.]|nr:hypothetical protein [Bdellovibrio sp.]